MKKHIVKKPAKKSRTAARKTQPRDKWKLYGSYNYDDDNDEDECALFEDRGTAIFSIFMFGAGLLAIGGFIFTVVFAWTH